MNVFHVLRENLQRTLLPSHVINQDSRGEETFKHHSELSRQNVITCFIINLTFYSKSYIYISK